MLLDAIMRKISYLEIVLDMESVVDYVHEYAWQTCKWEGIDPHEAKRYRAKTMIQEAYHVLGRLQYIKMVDKLDNIDFSVCMSGVNTKVRREHGGGIPLNYKDHDKS